MKTVIVSDIHLTHRYDERKFLFLKELFSSADKIILNGDFWDGYITTFDRFVDSPWKNLFPLLREKEAIYLYGNHDQKRFSDERVSLFSMEQKDYHELMVKNEVYHVEHGQILCPSIDMIYPLSRTSLYYINVVFNKIEALLVYLKSPHNSVLKYENRKIKKKLQLAKVPYFYICGHTHYPEIDKDNKFANSGYIQYKRATYLIIDSSGLSFHAKKY